MFCLSFCLPFFLGAQNLFNLEEPVEIPFSYYNDFIIVDVIFDNRFPLKFIFDTGAEHTVLLKREIADISGIPFERRFEIIGSDMRTPLFAYLIRQIPLEIGPLKIPSQSMLVLEEDYFDFEKKVGTEIQGIIGADIFRAYRIHINYEKRTIKFAFSGQEQLLKRNFTPLPLELYKNKPYLLAKIKLADQTEIETKLLLDTGAGLALLLHTNTHSDLRLPEKVIPGEVGVGLGGELEGFIGRVAEMNLNDSPFKAMNVVTNFQEIDDLTDTLQLNGRNGLIGNIILRRFETVIDYPRSILYLKPNRNYRKKFKFDRSGLSFIAAGPTLTEYYVSKVIAGSPAHDAGMIRGDRLIRIDGISTWLMTFDGLLNKFKKKAGKRVRVTFRRNGVKMKRDIFLRDLI